MIEEMREKNRVRIVTAAFRNKFRRVPNTAELEQWSNLLKSGLDFQSFIVQLTRSIAGELPASAQNKPHQAIECTTSSMAVSHLGERANYFYALMLRSADRVIATRGI